MSIAEVGAEAKALYIDVNFHMEPDASERQELSELRLADLQSRPCPAGPAVGWWSSLHGPIPLETQSRPGRSPSPATSPSVSAGPREQQLSTFLLHFPASFCPLLSLLLCYLLCVLTLCPLSHSRQSSEGANRDEEARVPCLALPCPVWSWGSHRHSLGSALLTYKMKIVLLCV